MSISERALEYSKYKGLTAADFERDSGLANGMLKKLSDKTRRQTFTRIGAAFPDLNIEWLRTGQGDMLLKVEAPVRIEESVSDEDNDSDYVPLLPVEAMAGTLQGLSEGVALANCRKIKSPVKGADWAIQISGDSMEPDFRNGSYLYIKKMTGKMIPWGSPLVVDTLDGVVFKKIFQIEGSKDYVEARSINPNNPPFEIDKSIILGMYRILGGSFIISTI